MEAAGVDSFQIGAEAGADWDTLVVGLKQPDADSLGAAADAEGAVDGAAGETGSRPRRAGRSADGEQGTAGHPGPAEKRQQTTGAAVTSPRRAEERSRIDPAVTTASGWVKQRTQTSRAVATCPGWPEERVQVGASATSVFIAAVDTIACRAGGAVIIAARRVLGELLRRAVGEGQQHCQHGEKAEGGHGPWWTEQTEQTSRQHPITGWSVLPECKGL